jgi:hypothetical protein
MSRRIQYNLAMAVDVDKLKALTLYIIWRAGYREGFGATKLNKVLWFSDARHFVMYGKPITGATYLRERHGPVPERISELRNQLQSTGQISTWSEPYFGGDITRFTTDAPPDTTMFTADELSVVDWWIKHVADEHSARSISELSHNYTWEIAGMGEAIPLYAVLASRIRAPLGQELDWAKAEAKRLGLVE